MPEPEPEAIAETGAALGTASQRRPPGEAVASPADVGSGLAILAVIEADRPSPGERQRWRTSLAAALAAHVALVAGATYTPRNATIGFDGVDLDSVSIEIIPASTLSARAADASAAPGATTLPVDPFDGSAAEREASAPSPDREAKALAETARAADARPDIVIADWTAKLEPPKPDDVVIVIAPKPAEAAPEPKDRREAVPAERPATEAKTPTAAAAAIETASLGGAAAAASDSADAAAAGRSTAARGADMTAYDRTLVAALGALQRQVQRSAARQSGVGRGRLVLRLTIGPDGAAETVTVAASSGQARLDSQAVADVRGFRFPEPPASASQVERTYHLPITYR